MGKKLKIHIVYHTVKRAAEETDDTKLAEKFVGHLVQICVSDDFEFIYFHNNMKLGRSKFAETKDLSKADVILVIVTPDFEQNGFEDYKAEVAFDKRFKERPSAVIPIIIGENTKLPDNFQTDGMILEFDRIEYEHQKKQWEKLKKTLIEAAGKTILGKTDGKAVPGLNCDPDSSQPNKSNPNIGQEFRKTTEQALDYEWMKRITDGKIDQRVGKIKLPDATGTGFRIGDAYIASAYHIFRERIHSIWVQLYHKAIECVKDNLDEFASKLKVSVDDQLANETTYSAVCVLTEKWMKDFYCRFQRGATFKDFADTGIFEGKLTNTGLQRVILQEWRAQITFSLIKETSSSTGDTFGLDPNIEFYDEVKDVIILKLVQEEGKVIPPPFAIYLGPTKPTLHLFGHPGEKNLQVDPKCEVYTDDKKFEKLKNDTKSARKYFEDNNQEWSKDCDLEELKVQYDDVPSLCKGYVIFHCSKSITQGASGSPLILTEEDIKFDDPNAFKVQVMLQSGVPKELYNDKGFKKMENLPPRVYFEKGISMGSLHEALKVVPDLRENLFGTPPKTTAAKTDEKDVLASTAGQQEVNQSGTSQPNNSISNSAPQTTIAAKTDEKDVLVSVDRQQEVNQSGTPQPNKSSSNSAKTTILDSDDRQQEVNQSHTSQQNNRSSNSALQTTILYSIVDQLEVNQTGASQPNNSSSDSVNQESMISRFGSWFSGLYNYIE